MTGASAKERYDPRVSNMPPPPAASPAWQPVAPPAPSKPSRLLGSVSLGIALVATGIAIGAWLRPVPKYQPPPAPTYSAQQVADAKAKVCAAYAKVRRALNVAGARDNTNDPATSLVVATSSRQALEVGSRYLLSELAEEPATASELAAAVRNLAEVYQELTINYLADAEDSEINPLRQAAMEPTSVIDENCK